MIVSERLCRLIPSDLGSGDSPRELGGDVAGVASSDAQLSEVEQLDAAKDFVLTSRIKEAISIAAGKAAIMKYRI